jgi:5-formyltetrahydrofolate cyclo-ligase
LAVASSIDDSRGSKPATRRTLLARRDGLTVEERLDASHRIATRALALLTERVAPAAAIALYAAKGSEVETAPIDVALRRAGFRIAYPRVVDGDRVLAFHEALRDELVTSRFALFEPRTDVPRVALDEIAAFVVPGLAFDRSGGRVGWGRGHYDATFARARVDALRVGLAFACQLVERVPREAHDALVNAVVTEDALYTV